MDMLFEAYQAFERRIARGEFDAPKKPGQSQKKNQPEKKVDPEFVNPEQEQVLFEQNLEQEISTPTTKQEIKVEKYPPVETKPEVVEPVHEAKEPKPIFIEPELAQIQSKLEVPAVALQAKDVKVDVTIPPTDIQKPVNPDLDLLMRQFATELGTDLVTTVVVGTDGNIFSGKSNDPTFNSTIAAASISLILQLAARAGDKVGLGQVDNNMTSTDRVYIIARFIGDGSYCWGVIVLKNATLGFIRLMMNEYADKIWLKIMH
jgi:predicted regulator of Ras-like GTPase activity (Roadblock/LC7/MglB family)